MHMVSDATHGVPLTLILTPANAADSPQLPGVVKKVTENYPWLGARYMLADRGYDTSPTTKSYSGWGLPRSFTSGNPDLRTGCVMGFTRQTGGENCETPVRAVNLGGSAPELSWRLSGAGQSRPQWSQSNPL